MQTPPARIFSVLNLAVLNLAVLNLAVLNLAVLNLALLNPAVVTLAVLAFAGSTVSGGLVAQSANTQDPKIPAHDGDLKKTSSGLQYAVLAPGKKGGDRAGYGDFAELHLAVWRQDGTLIEDSRKGDRPVSMQVGSRMLPGLAEGLTLIPEGGRYKLVVPPSLAFGDRGGPKKGIKVAPVPPNTTLIYDVEVVTVRRGRRPLPRFRRIPKEQEKKLADGLTYKELRPGKGEPPAKNDIVELRYAMWNTHGQLISCSELPAQRNMKRSSEKLRDEGLAFFKQALPLLRPGGRYQFQVPASLAYRDQEKPLVPKNSETTWQLELVRTIKPLPVPRFEKPPLARTTRTKSGLRYQVIRKGTGKKPKATDTVFVHYAGWLTDGKLFDASYPKGEPVSFPLNRVIAGWTEGMQLMKEGAIYKFTIPAGLAYGIRGRPDGDVPPNATLVFQIELVKVEKPKRHRFDRSRRR